MSAPTPWEYRGNCRVPDGCELPAGLHRVAAVVEYDGSRFCGWQRQAHCASVQQEVETALSRIADEPVRVSCAGRTDTGVHATAQVIHFDTGARRAPHNWLLGANAQLPRSVRLQWAQDVEAGFHARFSALARTYRYVIHNSDRDPALLRDQVGRERRPLDVRAMESAGQLLLGERDFSAFRGAGCQSQSPKRNLIALHLWSQAQFVIIEITANAFLLHMVRNIVGALCAIGRGERPPRWIAELLASRDRSAGEATAAPTGLYLVGVHYPPRFAVPALVGGPCFVADTGLLAQVNLLAQRREAYW